MAYLIADKNTLLWFMFTLYAVSALFIIPNRINYQKVLSVEAIDEKAVQFTSRFILRIALIFPMLFIVKNTL